MCFNKILLFLYCFVYFLVLSLDCGPNQGLETSSTSIRLDGNRTLSKLLLQTFEETRGDLLTSQNQ